MYLPHTELREFSAEVTRIVLIALPREKERKYIERYIILKIVYRQHILC